MSALNNRGTAGVMAELSNGQTVDLGQWNAERNDVPPPQLRIVVGLVDTVDAQTADIDRPIKIRLTWNVGEARFSTLIDACNGVSFVVRAHYVQIEAIWTLRARHMAQSTVQVNCAITRDVGEPGKPPTFTDPWTSAGPASPTADLHEVPAFARAVRVRMGGSTTGYGLTELVWTTAASGGSGVCEDPVFDSKPIDVPQGARFVTVQSYAPLPVALRGGLLVWEIYP